VRVVAAIVQDPGDEKAGQDEEQFDAVGPVVGYAHDGALYLTVGWYGANEVEQQNQQNGEAPDAIQHGQVSAEVGQ
jgi:hypothetical protein